MPAFTLFFTGISGSGKTTLALALLEKLTARNVKWQVLDGDVLREDLGNLFGYTKEERYKNSKVVQTLCRYLNQNDINVILAIVAPYEAMRRQIRSYLGENTLEVYVRCPYETCVCRDVKGYYKKIKDGTMQNLNGADDVYEPPQQSHLILDTGVNSIEECVNMIVRYLQENNYEI